MGEVLLIRDNPSGLNFAGTCWGSRDAESSQHPSQVMLSAAGITLGPIIPQAPLAVSCLEGLTNLIQLGDAAGAPVVRS